MTKARDQDKLGNVEASTVEASTGDSRRMLSTSRVVFLVIAAAAPMAAMVGNVPLALFDGMWAGLAPGEQARVLGLLVRRVDYDGARGRLAITFHPSGIKALADELTTQQEGRSA